MPEAAILRDVIKFSRGEESAARVSERTFQAYLYYVLYKDRDQRKYKFASFLGDLHLIGSCLKQ